jgi:hypothetical protein
MNIDISVLVLNLKEEAGKLFLAPEGEEVLVKLLELQNQVEQAIQTVKDVLVVEGSQVNPNFTSIQADKIKVAYRSYGQRFYIDESHIELAPPELYTKEQKISYKVDSKAVEKWIDEKGRLPAGINESDRPKTLSITLKKNAQTTGEL